VVLGLAISPAYAHDRTLYAATRTGIHVSHDGAGTWVRSPTEDAPARAVASAPSSTPTVLAALAGGVLLVSDDGATTWRTLAALPAGAGILLVAVSPDYALDRTIFVATTSEPGPGASGEVVLWRSVDGGERGDRWLVEGQAAGSQQFLALAVSPSYARDAIVFAGLGARVLKPLRHASEVWAGQRRPIWHGTVLGAGAVAVTAVAPSPSYATDRTVFAATNMGMFVSRDGGEAYQPWSEGLVPPGLIALAISPTYGTDCLVYALGVGGTIWRCEDQDPTRGGHY
jgi:hypothetical protein